MGFDVCIIFVYVGGVTPCSIYARQLKPDISVNIFNGTFTSSSADTYTKTPQIVFCMEIIPNK